MVVVFENFIDGSLIFLFPHLLSQFLHLSFLVPIGQLKKLGLLVDVFVSVHEIEITVTAESLCQVNVLFHYCYSLRVDGAEIGIFKQTNKVGLCGLLDRLESLLVKTHGVV